MKIQNPTLQQMVLNPFSYTSPIFTPKKHTKETYRSQQRKAKQRRKSKKYSKKIS